MNRDQRRQLAEETVRILDTGSYRLPSGGYVSLSDDLANSIQQTILYRPGDFHTLIPEATERHEKTATITVTSETTLQAASDACRETDAHVCCLNFASARNPGGGFLGGSQAQEESLARSSGLYASLMHKGSEFYEHNRNLKTALYSDYLIYSPRVPVFRSEDGGLLAIPYFVSFVTTPAVNAGAVRQNEPQSVSRIVPMMRQRAGNVFAVAAANRCTHLILGAWGCGVFQNDPIAVADVFHNVLYDGDWNDKFRAITFAVYDNSKDQQTFRAFRQRF
jgi:uncharacterized protein (TIGR02452 family)